MNFDWVQFLQCVVDFIEHRYWTVNWSKFNKKNQSHQFKNNNLFFFKAIELITSNNKKFWALRINRRTDVRVECLNSRRWLIFCPHRCTVVFSTSTSLVWFCTNWSSAIQALFCPSDIRSWIRKFFLWPLWICRISLQISNLAADFRLCYGNFSSIH